MLVAIKQAVHEILVGKEVVYKLFLKDEERVVQLVQVHVPLLKLKRRNDEHRAGMQFYPLACQKQVPFRFVEEIELEKVGLVPFVRIEPAALFRAFRRVQQEVHATRAFGVFQQGNTLRGFVGEYAVSFFMIHKNGI
ncbi:hypothetical protein BACCOPRO_01368 [Phocaeicola coprophilus DSM 18228 = JCM 13818]|uniref:Uncharacterized protein n=1 Tax=Phocaeicola coprophilus DSM 18228 = JCM 13818 TaxID=547042 RepID=S0F6H8_9BACT|nr:hypothetical protein BACCOPRO_01368 [Phocaeicola coprophilus DSM 18228 = JCM 13818]